MTAKRFTVFGEWHKDDIVDEIRCDGDTLTIGELVELLNELHEENQSIKKHIRELYKIVKFDVDNEIEVYPKVLLEYIVNILKIIGDVE